MNLGVIMKSQEVVERIMSAHWGNVECRCWICEAGRKCGYSMRESLLPHKHRNRQRYPVPISAQFRGDGEQ